MRAALLYVRGRSEDHPGMDTTDTVDFGVLLSGEIWLELDDGPRSISRRATRSSRTALGTPGTTGATSRPWSREGSSGRHAAAEPGDARAARVRRAPPECGPQLSRSSPEIGCPICANQASVSAFIGGERWGLC